MNDVARVSNELHIYQKEGQHGTLLTICRSMSSPYIFVRHCLVLQCLVLHFQHPHLYVLERYVFR